MLTMNPIVEATPYSKLRVVFNKVENRPELTKFTLGEPNFDTAPHIVEAACKAMRDGHTHYVHNAGVMELREAIAEKLQRELTSAVAIAKPLKIASPTGAEWSAEKVTMIAAIAANSARPSCRCRTSKVRGVASVTKCSQGFDGRGTHPV